MLNYAIELYNKAMTNEVLSWDDTGNNLLLAGGRGSWIQNPISSLRTIEKDNPELAKKIYISNTPAGPKGRFASVSVDVWGVMNWSKNVPAAKALLTEYYAAYLDGVKASEGYNQPVLMEYLKKPIAILGEDPKFQSLQDFDQAGEGDNEGRREPPVAYRGQPESEPEQHEGKRVLAVLPQV
jgi:ABC-type glycerol-3-phosphate transport system substrate-binding protein